MSIHGHRPSYYRPHSAAAPPRQVSHQSSHASYYGGAPQYGGAPPYAGYGRPPPAGADPVLWGQFTRVDQDGSGTISVTELRSALVNGNYEHWDLDTVKMLMNMFDVDRSGTISFTEFAGLWNYVKEWQDCYRMFDRDGSGTIDGHELANALRSFGYNLSPFILSLVEQKYASGPVGGYGPPPGISFDRFVRACVVVKHLSESFQRFDTDRDGWVQLNYEDFLRIVLQAP